MRRQGTPVSREALYEEVWTDAVTVVAPRYGLSDVGLVQICKKLGIPVAPRGYWAKVKAGRLTRKVPLPSLPAGARGLTGPIPLTEQEAATHARVRDALQQTRESQPSVSVPDELVDPHPLVRAAAARLKRRTQRPSRSSIAAGAAPPAVTGLSQTSSHVTASCDGPAKRSSSSPGRSCAAAGGMKRAQAARHSGVNGNCCCHQSRQRCSVRRATPSCVPSRAAAGVGPARRADTSTTASARYTRRPRKRTDFDVDRLRHRAQQKLSRNE